MSQNEIKNERHTQFIKSFNTKDFNARNQCRFVKNLKKIPIKIPSDIKEIASSTTRTEKFLPKNKMNETDYISGASALQQEMNLARRACWNSKHKRKTLTEYTQCCENKENKENEKNENFDYENFNVMNVHNENYNDNELKNGIEDKTTALYGANVSENFLNANTTDTGIDADPNENRDSASAKVNLNKKNIIIVNNLIKHKIQTQVPDSLVNDKKIILNNKNKNNRNHNERVNDVLSGNNFCVQMLKFWLTFVAFCDSITIKHDDPRFDAYKKCNCKPTNSPKQPQENQPHSMMTSKYRLLCNKKFIFLFVVCIFFSFLNRIDARPNGSAFSNLITDSAVADGTENEKLPEVAKLTIAANPTESVLPTLPLASNVIPKKHVSDSQPAQDEGRHLILSSPDDEELPHPERYPVSQVDFGRVKTPFIIGIWILSASIAKIGFHMTPKLHLIFPESCLLIVVGVVIGIVLYMGNNVAVSPLTPNTFFFYMLPPIILDAGYFMPNRLFFDNLGTILLMAVVGTIFNIATIGGALWACGQGGIYGDQTPKLLDIFIFASLISAVDPVAVLAVFEEIHVNEILYIVVFGESLLNDAVTVVMYHMMEVYNEIGISKIIAQDLVSGVGSFFVVAIGGTVIGIIWGVLTGLVTRFTDHVRVIEPIFIFVMAYLAYLNAEIFHMSGILAITFCGITMKNYVESNISQKSHTTVKYALKMLSSSSETIIFMFLGVATVNNTHVWNTWFVILTIVFCSVFRVIGVIILTAVANRFRLHKLSRVDQFVMSYGGLRGAVAFALVLLIDERIVKDKNMFVTTTIAVIYFTVFLQGITIKPLVKFLNVKRANKRKPTMNERIHERFMDHLMAGIEDIVGKTGNYNVRDKFKRFDNRFIRPLLIRDLKGAEPKIIETYSKLTMRDAMEVMRRNPSTIGQISGTESMSALFRNYTNNCIGGRWAPPTIYTTCPSLTNLDNTCSRNLDMHELDYNPSKKDLTDARIHHLLAEELKPYRRASQQMHRRLSYSRHAVDDRDLSTQVNYKMQMNFRRMFNDRKHHKRSKRGNSKQPEPVKQNHVSFHDFQQNGSTKQFSHDYINEVLNESADEKLQKSTDANISGGNDDWDDGLTFTAKSTPDSDLANNNSLIAHIQNLPGFDASKARIVQHYASASKKDEENPAELLSPEFGPTAAELILPWRRDRSYPNIVAEHPIPEEDRNLHGRDSDGEPRVSTPTAIESQLPWKRQGDEVSAAVQQNEFPAWASNKEYLAYNSPSATFLGGINKPKQPKSVIGLFRRESSGSKGGGSISETSAGSDPALAAALAGSIIVPSTTTATTHNPRLDKRSLSISAGSGVSGDRPGDTSHSGPFAVTASHRRNVRRGSMLELTGLILTGRRPSKLLNFSPILHNSTNISTTNSPSTSTNTTTATSPSNNITTTTSTTTITTINNDHEIIKNDQSFTNDERKFNSQRLDEEDIIPEETHTHGHSKSLCEPGDDDNEWNITIGAGATGLRHERTNSGSSNVSSDRLLRNVREPLLPRLTPRAQIKRGMSAPGGKNQVTTALLSTSNSDYDDDESEDFDLYDDENIVVTTLTTGRNRSGSNGSQNGNASNSGVNTTTTIRLTRNNDESII